MSRDNDAYKKFVCAILETAVNDAMYGEQKDRAWIYSQDARMLCEMADLDYENFRDGVLKKIEHHQNKRRHS